MDTIKRLPTHPGDILKEELECRRISQKKFSEILGVPYTMLNEILNGKRPIQIVLLYLFGQSIIAVDMFLGKAD